MKNKIKLIGFVLCFVMVLSFVAVPVIFAEEDFDNAYGLLNALGIFTGENTPDATVKRKQIAVYLNRITGAPEVEGTLFYDVSEDLPEAGAINAVAQGGYMIGSEGCFYPERPVSFNEAITVLLRAAGYTRLAIDANGYVAGYLKWANSSGLLKNISSYDGELNEGTLAKLLKNFLDINIVAVSAYTAGGENEEIIDKNISVLNNFFDAEKVKGNIVATSNVAVWGRNLCGTEQVVISTNYGDVVYKREGVDYDDKLALNAVFYVHEDEKEIIYAEYKYADGTEVKFSGDDIREIDKSLFSISYYDNTEKVKTIDTSNASFIYNGKSLDEITDDMVKTDFSVIECRDADGDRKFDVVYVWDYDVIMVDSINFSNYKILDKITGKIIDFAPDKCEVSVKMNGGDFNIAGIKEYYTLLVARSEGTSDFKLRIEVFPDCVGGIITTVNEGESIEVDGEKFNVRQSFTQKYSPQLGGEYVVGIDFDGNALCLLKNNYWQQKYGYALNLDMIKRSKDDIEIRLFTENNKFEILKFAKKFKLNGEKADYGMLEESGLFSDGKFISQLVSYKTNSEGLITNINVAKRGEPDENGSETLTLNRSFSKSAAIADDYFNIYNNVALFSTEYVGIDGITKSFRIMKNGDEFVEGEFLVGTASEMGVSAGVFDIDVYDASYERIVGAAVYTVNADAISNVNSDVYGFLVSNIKNTTNADGEKVIEITGYTQGKKMSFIETELYNFEKVRCGDVLVTWDAQTKLKTYKIMFSLDESTFGQEYLGYDSTSDEFWVLNKNNLMRVRLSGFFREIVSKSPSDGNVFLTKTKKTGTLRPVTVATYTNYYIYDTETGKVSIASAADLDASCKNVYFVATYGVARDVIIYK